MFVAAILTIVVPVFTDYAEFKSEQLSSVTIWTTELTMLSVKQTDNFLFFSDKILPPASGVSLMEPSNQPAKLADRVLAPGDGFAEPGVLEMDSGEPAKLAIDGLVKRLPNHFDHSKLITTVHLPPHFVGSDAFWFAFPGLGKAIARG